MFNGKSFSQTLSNLIFRLNLFSQMMISKQVFPEEIGFLNQKKKFERF